MEQPAFRVIGNIILKVLASEYPDSMDDGPLFDSVKAEYTNPSQADYQTALNYLEKKVLIVKHSEQSAAMGVFISSFNYTILRQGLDRVQELSAGAEPRSAPPRETSPVPLEQQPTQGPVRAFISHSNKDKSLAGNLKEALAVYGIEGFIAHEDIEPLAQWRKVILAHLAQADILVVLVSMNSIVSHWVNQEVGHAMARGITVVPIKVDADPIGFLSDTQALAFKSPPYGRLSRNKQYDCELCAQIIATTMASQKGLEERMKHGMAMSFARSMSYYETRCLIGILDRFSLFTDDEVTAMVTGGIRNGQIHREGTACEFLRRLLDLYPRAVSMDHQELLMQKMPQ